jgi:hypothetical protein
MLEGYAGGIQPWWHFISAYHEDRRQYQTPVSLLRWHAEHEAYLIDRQPVATVGVVWSQENIDFFGRDQAHEQVVLPYNGMIKALIRARIPYLPIHADHIARDAAQLTTLILPNVGALSEAQLQSVRDFVANGGSLIVSGQTSLYTEQGERRPDFALADLLGVHATDQQLDSSSISGANWETFESHSYLRLSPALRRQVDGPQTGQEPEINSERHPVLSGFGETDILPFGGRLELVRVESEADTPLTFIPAFPIYPPEFAWMRQPTTDHAALVLRTTVGGGRIVYLAADVDRLFARDNLPDHGDLLANLIRWAGHDTLPLRVEGIGLIDCHLYHQPGRLVLHLVNLTATGQTPVHAHIPVGPFQVTVQCPADVAGTAASLLVDGQALATRRQDDYVTFEVPSITAHEVVVVR